MVINYTKSKQILFKRKKDCVVTHPDIETCLTAKILGVHWDSSLTWKTHFEQLLKVCAQRLYVFRILKPVISVDLLCVVYNSIVVSILLYAAPLFASLPLNISQKIEKFNRRAHRLICGKECSCNRFPSISSLRIQRARRFFMKCESNVAHPLHSLVPERMHNSGHFRLPLIRSSRRLNSFFPYICVLINSDFQKQWRCTCITHAAFVCLFLSSLWLFRCIDWFSLLSTINAYFTLLYFKDRDFSSKTNFPLSLICFCNAPKYVHDMLLKIERRILCIISYDDNIESQSLSCEADTEQQTGRNFTPGPETIVEGRGAGPG